MQAKKLSPAQYTLIEIIRKNGKAKCTDGNRKTYKKLIEFGLVDYNSSYDYVILTEQGKALEL